MKVLRHEHPGDQQEIEVQADLAQNIDEAPSETIIFRQLGAAIGAGGDKVPLARLEAAVIDRHQMGISAGVSET